MQQRRGASPNGRRPRPHARRASRPGRGWDPRDWPRSLAVRHLSCRLDIRYLFAGEVVRVVVGSGQRGVGRDLADLAVPAGGGTRTLGVETPTPSPGRVDQGRC